jgi:hypothetical protein
MPNIMNAINTAVRITNYGSIPNPWRDVFYFEPKKRSIGRKQSPLLQLMRRMLRGARVVAKAESAGASKTKEAAG